MNTINLQKVRNGMHTGHMLLPHTSCVIIIYKQNYSKVIFNL